MNGQRLSIGHGAPVRLRVERQLGYKLAKYFMRVEAVDGAGEIAGEAQGTEVSHASEGRGATGHKVR
jgi:DMSO/TMAO reductase YedYZ molybdopterin-dependent catalytic subunit